MATYFCPPTYRLSFIMIKIGGFRYSTNNLGDEIQSIAAEQHLPNINRRFERDTLAAQHLEYPHLLVMNGWFSHFPYTCLPTADKIIPVFFGFHISNWNIPYRNYFFSDAIIEYFKNHEPIGCRDKKTANLLQSHGVDAFYSKCPTLTFPKRKSEPKNPKTFIVDLDKEIPIPQKVAKNAIYLSHSTNNLTLSTEDRFFIANKLLDTYRNEAGLVITSRLHAALPCIAMGIPVIFFGNPKDYRTSIISDIGLKIHPNFMSIPLFPKFARKHFKRFSIFRKLSYFLYYFFHKIDWNPKIVEFEAEKEIMINTLKEMIHRKANISN